MFVIINRNKLVVQERNGTISGVAEEQKSGGAVLG